MIELPIDRYLGEIGRKVREANGLVVVATPGAGKSTRVPPALLESVEGAIVMLQPRRVAARAIATRIAQEHEWDLGREVGYHVRFEKRYGKQTRIRVMTEGILTRMMLDDPYLEAIGCVILDEFHERNLHTDLAAAFLREVQQTVRPELKVVVMSATLDANPVAEFFGVEVVEVEGRVWPVDITWRPGRDLKLEEHVGRTVEEAIASQEAGDVLVFLPGVSEIERVRRWLTERGDLAIVPLHGSLAWEEQQRALLPDARGRRKVILATNIAETSLTIDGVRTVVDLGLARVASFDPDRGMNRLDLERISKASATQRSGRAGRQAPGRAFRLWAQAEEKHLADFNVPEVERVDLSQAILAVHAWGARDARAFGWFETPNEQRLVAAEGLLQMLDAVDSTKNELTEIGRAMVGMPVHPRVARMLFSALGDARLLEQAVRVAAMLGDDSRRGWGDLLSAKMPAHLERAAEQLTQVARNLVPPKKLAHHVQLAELLLLAYPDRVARRRGNDPHAGVLVDGSGVRIAEEAFTPAIAASELFLALEVHHDPRNRKAEALVRTWAILKEEWLTKWFPDRLRTATALRYDAEKRKVVAVTRRTFGDLVLEEDPHGKVDPERAGEVLAEALAPQARDIFLSDGRGAKLLARVALVRQCVPEKPWPKFDAAELQDVLREVCRGKKSLAEIVDGPAMENGLKSRLTYPLDRELERLAPETIEVPSGSRIKLEYSLPAEDGAAVPTPVLAVRLQELFGWTQTPRICGGRLPVLLHLLSPGFKPMQITSDLASFWRSAYFEVRKDLRVRYPKHKWPEDPLTATPEAKGRRRQ